MIRYERIRFEANGRRRTIYLRITGKKDTVLSTFVMGIEVDKGGNEISGRDFDERLHLIDEQAIIKRTPMVMNTKYCELEVVKPYKPHPHERRSNRRPSGIRRKK